MHGYYILRNDLTAVQTEQDLCDDYFFFFVSTTLRHLATSFPSFHAAQTFITEKMPEYRGRLAIVWFP